VLILSYRVSGGELLFKSINCSATNTPSVYTSSKSNHGVPYQKLNRKGMLKSFRQLKCKYAELNGATEDTVEGFPQIDSAGISRPVLTPELLEFFVEQLTPASSRPPLAEISRVYSSIRNGVPTRMNDPTAPATQDDIESDTEEVDTSVGLVL